MSGNEGCYSIFQSDKDAFDDIFHSVLKQDYTVEKEKGGDGMAVGWDDEMR